MNLKKNDKYINVLENDNFLETILNINLWQSDDSVWGLIKKLQDILRDMTTSPLPKHKPFNGTSIAGSNVEISSCVCSFSSDVWFSSSIMVNLRQWKGDLIMRNKKARIDQISQVWRSHIFFAKVENNTPPCQRVLLEFQKILSKH